MLGRFGLLEITQAGDKTIAFGATSAAAGNLLMTELGIKAQVHRAKRGFDMLANPGTQWTAYETALGNLATTHGASVKANYDALMTAGYSSDIAEKVAKEKNTRAFLDSKSY